MVRIVATLRERGSSESQVITANYLVGADGATSRVLDSMGIPVDGQMLSDAFGVHIKADLSKYFTPRPGSLVWTLNPDAPGWSTAGSIRMVRP
jgi:2-polyprenyl-6-methoxyphenol hydroxylase-like FAD-dependent oxidoreductase